jgi:UDP-N-acetylmuramate dehydrogenase
MVQHNTNRFSQRGNFTMDQIPTPRRYQKHVSLAPLTTIGLGGEAKFFSDCSTAEEIVAVLNDAKRRGLRVQILGGGSNLIFSDAGYDGLVLRISGRGITWTDEGATMLVSVRAGERWDNFVASCVRHGYGGVECLSGIPGSVGATPIQNVGAYGQEVKDTIDSVTAVNRTTGAEAAFTNAECEFGYRESRFKSREKNLWIVTEVRFRLRKNAAPTIVYPELRRHLEATLGAECFADPRSSEEAAAVLTSVREAVIALRRKKSMVIDPADPNTRSVGSFFMNPVLEQTAFAALQGQWEAQHPDMPVPSFPSGAYVKVPAAWLIEHAGFRKGYKTAGGAGISANHTLALINDGGTTRALLALAREIQEAVASAFGIRLEREAIVVE